MSKPRFLSVLAAIGLAVLIATGCASAPPSDSSPPDLFYPDHLTFPADGAPGVIVEWVVWAIDDVDGDVPVTCTPPAGWFPVGQTHVTCWATDRAGNTTTATFIVFVSI